MGMNEINLLQSFSRVARLGENLTFEERKRKVFYCLEWVKLFYCSLSYVSRFFTQLAAGGVRMKRVESDGIEMWKIMEDDVVALLPDLRQGGTKDAWNTLQKLQYQLLPHPDETEADRQMKRLHYCRVVDSIVEGICRGGAYSLVGHPRRLQEFVVAQGYAEESLMSLSEGLKECRVDKRGGEGSEIVSRLVELTEKVVRGPALFDMLLNSCVEGSAQSSDLKETAELMEREQKWAKLVHLLVSFPSLVANHMQKNLPLEFIPDNYCTILCGALANLFDELVEVKVPLHFSKLAKLLGKITVHFRGSLGIEKLMVHFIGLCHKSVTARTMIPALMEEVDPYSIEALADVIFCLCASPDDARFILGDECRNNHNWLGILCTRIPLMTYRGKLGWSLSDDKWLHNFVGYIGSGKGGGMRLLVLLKDLVDVWGDSSSCKSSDAKQHRWITAFILACCSRLNASMLWKEKLEKAPSKEEITEKLSGWKEEDLEDYKAAVDKHFNAILSKVFRGVMCHLESLKPQIRIMGMITGELVTKTFSFKMKSEKSKDEPPAPKFEYDNTDELVISLKHLYEMDFYEKELNVEDPGNWFSFSGGSGEMVRSVEKMDINVNTKAGVHSGKVFRDEENVSDVDSDDEFEPYDMSMDVADAKDYQPTTLHDMIEILSEGPVGKQGKESLEVRNKYFAYLEACPEVVRQQLSSNDSALAEELLLSLFHSPSVENSFFTEGQISSLVIKSMAAITAAHPISGARILSKRVYCKNSSVRSRLDALLALTQAARELSGFSKEDVKIAEKSLSFDSSEADRQLEKPWDAVVSERVESRTRRWGSCVPGRSKDVKIEMNDFLPVAGYFIFPLLSPEDKAEKNYLKNLLIKNGDGLDDVIVAQLLTAVGSLAVMSAGSPPALTGRIASVVLEAASHALRNPEANVRRDAVRAVGAAVASGAPNPYHALLHDAAGGGGDGDASTEGFRKLKECMTQLVVMGETDHDEECRSLATDVVTYVNSCLAARS